MENAPDLFSQLKLEAILPEIILVGGILILLIVDLLGRNNRGRVAGWGTIIVIMLSLGSLTTISVESGTYLFGSIKSDGYWLFFRILFGISTILAILMLLPHFPREGEPFLLMAGCLAGMNFVAGSGDIVTLFVALELVSIPSYVLAGYKRSDPRSAEAALKYLLYGAVSSGILVYGLSFFYGIGGTTKIGELTQSLESSSLRDSPAYLGAVLLVIAGIGYKIALVPLHFWAPDVYEGAPTPITAFFSVAPKVAGFAALYRLMPVLEPLNSIKGIELTHILVMGSALTMSWGNLAAIWQVSLKRLLAYSSIAHSGYILIGFAALSSLEGEDKQHLAIASILFYITVYMFMNLGAFWAVDRVESLLGIRKRVQVGESSFKSENSQYYRGSDHIHHFYGLGWTHPWTAVLLAIFLLSLTGLPPLAGFVGKFYLLAALVKAGSKELLILAMIAVVNTVISLYYYMKIVRDMFLHQPEDRVFLPSERSPISIFIGLTTLLPTLVLGIYFGPLYLWVSSLL